MVQARQDIHYMMQNSVAANAYPELLQFGEVGHIPDPLYAIVCKVKGHQVHLENDTWQG